MILKDSIRDSLEDIAKEFNIQKLVLFGSRATGKCWERSDIDLAAHFNSSKEYLAFCDRVEEIPTLLMLDVINLSSDMISLDLRKSINDEGVVLYEKV